jgi:hypothetical protein
LSPYLFLLVAEILACALRQTKNIKGITFGNEEIKLLQFADDITGTLSDNKSGKAFLDTVEQFGEFSGLKLNKNRSSMARFSNK